MNKKLINRITFSIPPGMAELFKALLHKLMTGEIRVEDLNMSSIRGSKAQLGAEQCSMTPCPTLGEPA